MGSAAGTKVVVCAGDWLTGIGSAASLDALLPGVNRPGSLEAQDDVPSMPAREPRWHEVLRTVRGTARVCLPFLRCGEPH